MANLGQEIRNAIRNLEAIRDKQKPPSQEILHQIDTLYDQAVDLVAVSINQKTKKYQDAAKQMQKAASAAREAINNLAKVEETIKLADTAIKIVAALLAAMP